MRSVKEKAFKFNKRIKVNFSGGLLTSYSGLLLYREFDEKTGFSRLIQEMLIVKDRVA